MLILGTMPGVASLEAQRYYAHPRNAFWPIVAALLDEASPGRIDESAGASRRSGARGGGGPAATGRAHGSPDRAGLPPYEERVGRVVAGGIALWDVLAECERPGSLDSAIRRGSERANDIPALCARHPELALVAFNGQTAAKLFARHVGAAVRAARPDLAFATLPSTSPAHASLSLEAKHAAWRDALGATLGA